MREREKQWSFVSLNRLLQYWVQSASVCMFMILTDLLLSNLSHRRPRISSCSSDPLSPEVFANSVSAQGNVTTVQEHLATVQHTPEHNGLLKPKSRRDRVSVYFSWASHLISRFYCSAMIDSLYYMKYIVLHEVHFSILFGWYFANWAWKILLCRNCWSCQCGHMPLLIYKIWAIWEYWHFNFWIGKSVIVGCNWQNCSKPQRSISPAEERLHWNSRWKPDAPLNPWSTQSPSSPSKQHSFCGYFKQLSFPVWTLPISAGQAKCLEWPSPDCGSQWWWLRICGQPAGLSNDQQWDGNGRRSYGRNDDEGKRDINADWKVAHQAINRGLQVFWLFEKGEWMYCCAFFKS